MKTSASIRRGSRWGVSNAFLEFSGILPGTHPAFVSPLSCLYFRTRFCCLGCKSLGRCWSDGFLFMCVCMYIYMHVCIIFLQESEFGSMSTDCSWDRLQWGHQEWPSWRRKLHVQRCFGGTEYDMVQKLKESQRLELRVDGGIVQWAGQERWNGWTLWSFRDQRTLVLNSRKTECYWRDTKGLLGLEMASKVLSVHPRNPCL